jgi:hypothetical protein
MGRRWKEGVKEACNPLNSERQETAPLKAQGSGETVRLLQKQTRLI